MRDYRKIKAWQHSDKLVIEIYRVTQNFPQEEKFGLTSQLRRAAYSVPANIAEGANRESQKDYLRFLYISRASLSETDYFLHLAKELGYLNLEEHTRLNKMLLEARKTLYGLIKYVAKELPT